MNKKTISLLLSAVALVVAGLVAVFNINAVAAAPASKVKTISFDVSEDMNRFIFDVDQAFEEDGLPKYGSAFITQGYIYPDGTLNGSDGVNPDGSPEFPDLVIGEWTCRGFLIGDGAHTASGPWVISTQYFYFNNGDSLVTEGYELADIDVENSRAVTGGTGAYERVTGVARQAMTGFNASEGVVLDITLELDY